MTHHHISWAVIAFETVKLLKFFGLLPGALAAFGMRKLYQSWRQRHASAGWPATNATVQYARVFHEGPRSFWAEITYSYFVGEYRSGTYVRRFRREAEAEEFVREVKEKQLQVRYKDSDPEHSVILDRDLQLVVMLAPQLR
jgi:hypothetical protein